MKKEFLEDYQNREHDEHEQYREFVKDGMLDQAESIFLQRLGKVTPPMTLCDRETYHEYKTKIWSQIPFSGTLIIPINNYGKEDFFEFHGFEASDLDKLIELAKETGKVTFVLSADARYYEGLEYLETLFNELRPPVMFTFPQDLMLDEMSLNKWHAEFDILASISFYDKLKEFARSHDMSDGVYDVISRKRNSTYVDLKILGFDALTEEISNLLIDDPDKAGLMLSAAQKFTNPFFYPIKSGQNTNMRRINEIREMGLTGDGLPPQIQKQERTVTYPVEIGSFLMRKTVPNPGSYYGCIEMMERYKANDLYKVLESLDKAIRDHNGDKTVRTVSDLDTILENVWKDASNIGKQKGIIEGGMGISLGALGSFAASMTGAGGGLYEGLLAGLGFMVAEKVLEKHNSSISDRIMRSLNRDYMMNIYDFANRKN